MDGAAWGSPLNHNDPGETLFQVPVFFRRCFTPDTACCTEVALGTNWSLRELQEDSAPTHLWGLPGRHRAMLETLLDFSPTLFCSASFLIPPAPISHPSPSPTPLSPLVNPSRHRGPALQAGFTEKSFPHWRGLPLQF